MAELKTAFWRKAARSLPAPYQARYAACFEQAERFDLAIGAIVDFFAKDRHELPRRARSA